MRLGDWFLTTHNISVDGHVDSSKTTKHGERLIHISFTSRDEVPEKVVVVLQSAL
jgi:hypothetical protein